MTPIPGNNATVRPCAGGATVTPKDEFPSPTEPKDGWLNEHWPDTNQPSPDQTWGYNLDWEALRDLIDRYDDCALEGDDVIKGVMLAYRRQQAERGMVEVRWLDLAIELGVEGAHNTMEYDDVVERLHAVVAAAQEQP